MSIVAFDYDTETYEAVFLASSVRQAVCEFASDVQLPPVNVPETGDVLFSVVIIPNPSGEKNGNHAKIIIAPSGWSVLNRKK
jgi:hypothetical protein